MKNKPKILRLLFLCLIPALTGFVLRFFLYRTGFDEKGILSSSNPLHLICCALVPAAALWLVLQLKSMKKRDFRPGNAAGVCRMLGGLAAGGLMAYSAVGLLLAGGNALAMVRALLAAAAALSMPLSVYAPREWKIPRLAGRALITLYFVLDMLARYQVWSGNPQLPDYVFHVAALVCLSLCSYHRLAFCTGIGKRKAHVFFSLMAMVLCVMAMIGPESKVFYLAGALWAGAGMCTLTPPAYPKKEIAEIQEETP